MTTQVEQPTVSVKVAMQSNIVEVTRPADSASLTEVLGAALVAAGVTDVGAVALNPDGTIVYKGDVFMVRNGQSSQVDTSAPRPLENGDFLIANKPVTNG